jgi:hypothetical protein
MCCNPGEVVTPDGACFAPEPHPYTACAKNVEPTGTETIEVGGWFVQCSVDDGPCYIHNHEDAGCYYARGPTLTEDVEELLVYAIQPCFGIFSERLPLTRHARAILSFERNEVPCVQDYQVDCRRVDDPAVTAALAEFDPTLSATIQGCCDLYGTVNRQPVCDVCPLFPIETCGGNGVVVVGDACMCDTD